MENLSFEIVQLNEWLENNAQKWEEKIATTPSLKGATWPEYYRSLKNVNQQNKFVISSIHWMGDDPLSIYLKNHENEFDVIGYTGGATYTRKCPI
jgi:hypothetical protein